MGQCAARRERKGGRHWRGEFCSRIFRFFPLFLFIVFPLSSLSPAPSHCLLLSILSTLFITARIFYLSLIFSLLFLFLEVGNLVSTLGVVKNLECCSIDPSVAMKPCVTYPKLCVYLTDKNMKAPPTPLLFRL